MNLSTLDCKLYFAWSTTTFRDIYRNVMKTYLLSHLSDIGSESETRIFFKKIATDSSPRTIELNG